MSKLWRPDGVGGAAEPAWAIGFRCGPVHLDVSGNAAIDRDWLTELMQPWCEAADPGGAPVRVRMVRSDRAAAALRREWAERRGSAARSAAVRCLRLDMRTVALEGWSDDGGRHLVDPETGCCFILDGGSVAVVAAPGERGPAVGLLRLLREAVVGGIAARWPTVDLHGAAFVLGGEAVVIAGPKKVGKTSLLIHAMVSAGAALLAGDRVLVQLGGARPVAHGVPTLVSIRPGTIAAFPQLLSRAAAFPPLSRIDPAVQRRLGDATWPSGTDGPELLLTPPRLAGRLGTAIAGPTALRAVVLPELCGDTAGWALERLPRDAALGRLEACRYGSAADRDAPTLFGSLAAPGSTPPPAAAGEALEALVSQLAVYRCRLGPAAYGQSAIPLLEALGLEASER